MATSGPVHDLKDIYLKKDEKKYGKFVPVKCKRGDVRFTLSQLAHGSRGNSFDQRRVVHPWLVKVDPDHKRAGNGFWDEVSAAHRDMTATQTGPVGESHRFKVGGRFAASIEMRGISALGDALVGARRWDSGAVLMERDLVLGSDEDEAWEYINKVRARMREEWKSCFNRLVRAESREYVENSYFKQFNVET